MKKVLSGALSFLLVVLMIMSSVSVSVFAADDAENESKLQEIRDLLNSLTYEEYLASYADVAKGTDEKVIKAEDYNKDKTTAKVQVETNYEGSSGKSLYVPETGNVSFDVDISKTGMYNVAIEYYPKTERASSIERALMIDGKYPFKEARYLEFTSVWKDEFLEGEGTSRGFLIDKNGNELRPTKLETPEWRTVLLRDSTGYYPDAFEFYLEKGTHTLTFAEVKESFVIKSIKVYSEDELKTYAEYKAENDGKGAKTASSENIIIEAEIADATSDQIIYPLNDRTSAITSPQDASLQVLNSIGGEKWQGVGQWVRWKVDVAESGYYRIGTRFLQNVYDGVYVSRKLYIDGEVPFKEAENLSFNFADEWQVETFGNGETEFEFYLEAGEHEIMLEAVLGDMGEIIYEVEQAMVELNNYYLKILMLTGPDPDQYRDYDFADQLPEIMIGFDKYANLLYDISAELEERTGMKGEHSVLLDNVAFLIRKMADNEYEIAPNFDTFKTYIGNLGTWVMDSQNQPLQLDYIVLSPVGNELPKAEANFFEALIHEFKAFIMSFFSDYNSLGIMEDQDLGDIPEIEVWIFSGRDQSQIVRNMIDDDFTSQHNIKANLKLVAAGTLLPATLSGTGPDVALEQAAGDAINYAIRTAVMGINPVAYMPKEGEEDTEELKKMREIFSDFDEVTKSFTEAAMIPLTLYDAAYGLPVTQTFSMLFYRMDILEQLDMEIPETWEDVYDMLNILQVNHLDFGFPNSLPGQLLLMYQNDIPLYKDPIDNDPFTFGMETNLDTNEALDCFKQMCELFTLYGFPYSYDFANRFRTGEMPLGVADYTMYNQLQIFAPEIRGLWDFTLLPGVVNEKTGKVNHTAAAGVTCLMMMRGCDDPASAWEFMKWWTGAEAQKRYGSEMVALLGASGQHATANLEALYSQAWTTSARKNIQEGFENITATPEVPGGYIISRYVQFAFLASYNDGADPVDSLLGYIEDINNELTRKREEFDLPTLDDYKDIIAAS